MEQSPSPRFDLWFLLATNSSEPQLLLTSTFHEVAEEEGNQTHVRRTNKIILIITLTSFSRCALSRSPLNFDSDALDLIISSGIEVDSVRCLSFGPRNKQTKGYEVQTLPDFLSSVRTSCCFRVIWSLSSSLATLVLWLKISSDSTRFWVSRDANFSAEVSSAKTAAAGLVALMF
jgi:hypothetical protein